MCRSVNVSMCRCVNVSMCQCVNVSMCQCVDVSMYRFVNVSICQCVNVSMCRSVNVSMCRCVDSPFVLYSYIIQHFKRMDTLSVWIQNYLFRPWCLVGPSWNSCWSKIQNGAKPPFWIFKLKNFTINISQSWKLILRFGLYKIVPYVILLI